MKKKVMVFGALLMATIITGFSVSGTYAKYISEATASDDARIAKWGIDLSTNNEWKKNIDLFKDSYNGDAIKSNESDDVIAPGAYGAYTLSVDSTTAPEVKYELKSVIEATLDPSLNDKVKFAVEEGSDDSSDLKPTSGYTITTVDQLQQAINEQLLSVAGSGGTATKTYEANQNAFGAENTFTIYWSWDFGTDDQVNADPNQSDTNLGKGAVSDTAKKVSLTITLTAKQLAE